MKVLINKCHGGFGVSKEFLNHLKTLKLIEEDGTKYSVERNNQLVIEEIIKFGIDKANSKYAELQIVEIPDGCNYSIGEYDGKEWIEHTWIYATLDELKTGLSDEQLSMVTQGCDIKLIQ